MLLCSSVSRLHLLCTSLLHRSYPRLTRSPLNVQSEEILSSVVERMMKAMKAVRPSGVRQFFALANKHIRWELNDLARKCDNEVRAVQLRESAVGKPPQSSLTHTSPNTIRILDAIESLPEDEREVFSLVRVQGMTPTDAAVVLGVTVRTVHRRLHRGLLVLAEKLRDLLPDSSPQARNSVPGPQLSNYSAQTDDAVYQDGHGLSY